MATPKKQAAKPAKKPAKPTKSTKSAKKPAKPTKSTKSAKKPAKKVTKPAKPAKSTKKPAKKVIKPAKPPVKGRPFPKKGATGPSAEPAGKGASNGAGIGGKEAKSSKDKSKEGKESKENTATKSAPATSATSATNDGFQRRLLLPPPPKVERKSKHSLKPLRDIPTPLVVAGSENPWSKDELKEMKARLTKDLVTYKEELATAEAQAAELLQDSSDGAGDDQADAGTKTFEREHELSLVYNAQDLVLQTELALARIASGAYTKCEICGNPIGKARLQVFPRATLCMLCKQKEERR